MALDNVIQVILDEAKKEAESIVAEGNRERAEAHKEAKTEVEGIKKKKLQEAEKLAERIRTQDTARAEIESKKLVLKAQKESLDRVGDIILA